MVKKDASAYGKLIASLGAIFAFLGGLVKVLSYFFDPEERKRRRRQDALNENKHDLSDTCAAIDDCDEDKLNEVANKISGRRRKSKSKGKNKCLKKGKSRYSRYCS